MILVLDRLPLPPTSNHMYATIMAGGRPIRIPSRESKAFKQAVQVWRLQNLQLSNLARAEFSGHAIQIDRYFAFRRERLWTLDGRPKSIDATNFIKPLDDALAEYVLGFDDRWFWSGTCEKIQAASPQDECALVVLTQMKPATLEELRRGRDSPEAVSRARRASPGQPEMEALDRRPGEGLPRGLHQPRPG